MLCFFAKLATKAIIKNINVALPVVKKLPEVLKGKISANNNKANGYNKISLKFMDKELLKPVMRINLVKIIEIIAKPKIPKSDKISR